MDEELKAGLWILGAICFIAAFVTCLVLGAQYAYYKHIVPVDHESARQLVLHVGCPAEH